MEHAQRYLREINKEQERLIARGATVLAECAAKGRTIEVTAYTILSYGKPKFRRYGEGKLMYAEPGGEYSHPTAVVQLADGRFVTGTVKGPGAIEVYAHRGKLGGVQLPPSALIPEAHVLGVLSRRLAEQHARDTVGPCPD